jgi:predicted small secreted protein
MKMRTLTRLLLAAFATCLLAGCNTIEGVGKDIKKGGEVIEKTAEKTSEKMKK